jgi:hypothetical protein
MPLTAASEPEADRMASVVTGRYSDSESQQAGGSRDRATVTRTPLSELYLGALLQAATMMPSETLEIYKDPK